ncbi:MAG TPA: hypothetical protein VFC67_10755 [Prolixibacteraceae bacterium]|nr:hypothetical protein [Prolixibacteraceae bacterium]
MTKEKIDNFEDEFKLIGFKSVLENADDKNINWVKFFQLTEDEKFYAANNDQIIEDDKNEDQIWNKF